MNEQQTKNEIIEKIKRVSRTSYVFSVLMVIIFIAAFVFTCIGLFYAMKEGITMKKGVPDYCENLAQIVIFIMVTCLVRNIFGEMKNDGSPFKPTIAKRLRSIGILVFLTGFVPQFIKGAAVVIQSSFSKAHFSVEFNGLIIGALFIFISQIFYYGTLLQKESDETV